MAPHRSRSKHHRQYETNGTEYHVAQETICSQNEATLVAVSPSFWRKPARVGCIYNVADARNFAGPDRGALSVVKWVRGTHECPEEDHIGMSVRTARKAAHIVYHFEKEVDMQGWRIRVNEPTTVTCNIEEHGRVVERFAMMEPHITRFHKFSSNSGWVLPSEKKYNVLLQALSHFSYAFSGGEQVLSNLKGGVDEEKKRIILTEPSISTTEGSLFGCTDIGEKGISNFFRWHKCSAICRHLAIPQERKILFRPVDYK